MKDFFKRLFTWLLFVVAFGGAYLHSMLLFMLLLCFVFVVIFWKEWPGLVPFEGTGAMVFTCLYPGAPMLGLLLLLGRYYGVDFYLPLYPFSVAWAADTGGYIVGKLCGWHKICPTISPGKSWQGLLGSIAAVYVVNVLMLQSIDARFARVVFTHSWYLPILFSIALVVIAFLGGLFLSILKRRKNLKDAGDILPGHGGFMDRFDSVFAVSIGVWILLLVPMFFKR